MCIVKSTILGSLLEVCRGIRLGICLGLVPSYRILAPYSGTDLTTPTESWEREVKEKTLYGQVEEAALSALRPATVHQVRVFAENELGRSKEGRVLQVSITTSTISAGLKKVSASMLCSCL